METREVGGREREEKKGNTMEKEKRREARREKKKREEEGTASRAEVLTLWAATPWGNSRYLHCNS